ncbi:MAG: carbon-nitrogen hydrolase family protein [Planctomycetes bacterium]|nr:carbon-nitrogen hydrolase family protein [Planctomycetota bacterium]
MSTKQDVYCRFAGAASGLMLAVPNMYSPLAPMQAVALVPILYFAVNGKVKNRVLCAAGMYMGLAYTLPQIIYLRLPAPITLILLVHLTVVMMLLVMGWRLLADRSAVWASFAAGAFFVVIDWYNFTAMPMWGTSQSIVRCWSKYPFAIQFTSLTGITGIVFVVGVLQAFVVYMISQPHSRRRLAAAAFAVVVIVIAANVACCLPKSDVKLTVAAIGWLSDDSPNCPDVYSEQGFEKLFAQPVAQAASQGARLVVSGEMGFRIDKHTRAEWLARFGALCRKHDIYLAVGCFDASDNENRLLFIDPSGEIVGRYTKTFLTPFEHSQRGDGWLTIVDIDGVRIGGMICQDDNFTSLTRNYGRKAAGVMAVPTLDWSTVRSVHLQTTVHRAIESRQLMVRAAVNGISAIISPTGKILAKCDHYKEGPGMICAEVNIHQNKTTFSRFGHSPVILSAIYLAFYIGRRHQFKSLRKMHENR